VGAVAQADGGTLFLDQIGDMPLAMQARLLRVLQDRPVTPAGSTRRVAFDVAILCATHGNLRQRVEQGVFRDDLYHRLNGLTVQLPPLRARSDLMALVRRILERECGGPDRQLAPDVARLFEQHPWPGNVRQLFNVLRMACLMAAEEPVITRAHLDDEVLAAAHAPAGATAADGTPRTLADLEIGAIRLAVEHCGGNLSLASRQLGISRNTLYRKLR
jgi:transcriptional regulator of acetoin/glycerol metabolism